MQFELLVSQADIINGFKIVTVPDSLPSQIASDFCFFRKSDASLNSKGKTYFG